VAKNAESLIVRADMSAFEFREAAWEACAEGTRPDPSTLSDRALYVVMQYEDRDLPSAAREALKAECRHRGLFPDPVDRLLGLGVIAFIAISGLAIGWMLFW
jgi:hypothetical protein